MLTYLLGPFIALLPSSRAKSLAERLGIQLRPAATLSGVAQGGLCVLGLAVWFLLFGQRFAQHTMGAYATKNPDNLKEMVFASYGSSVYLLFAFWTHPLTLALVYFAFEGIVRTLAPLLAEDQVGTLPLVLVDFAVQKARHKATRIREGPPIPDVVERGGEKDNWHLRIESCRPRRWGKLTTIRFEEQLYEIAAQFEGSPPRPFIYVLRHISPNKALRGIYNYAPDEVLRPDFEKSQTMKV